MKTKRWAVIVLCILSLLSLFGCKAKDKYLVDGPGMINPFAWETFSVSRSDSYAQHNFYITVTCSDDTYVATGTLIDDDGTEYEDEEGIVLPKSACKQIDELQPQHLPDVVPVIAEDQDDIAEDQDELFADDLFILDAPSIWVEVKYLDGRLLEKVDENDFSINVYQIVLPYFREKYN